jgi:hypothetical protein
MSDIRISAAGLGKIELDGKLLVGLNRAGLRAGKKRYTPFGGALCFNESARPFLEGLGAKFEKKNDLRFIISKKQLPKFEYWFYQRVDREISVYRELSEEFVDEEKIFPDLPENGVSLEYLTTAAKRGVTDKPGQEGNLTQWYHEIYKTIFTPNYEAMIRENLTKPGTHLGLVTKEEILAEISSSGIVIGDSCKPLISA